MWDLRMWVTLWCKSWRSHLFPTQVSSLQTLRHIRARSSTSSSNALPLPNAKALIWPLHLYKAFSLETLPCHLKILHLKSNSQPSNIRPPCIILSKPSWFHRLNHECSLLGKVLRDLSQLRRISQKDLSDPKKRLLQSTYEIHLWTNRKIKRTSHWLKQRASIIWSKTHRNSCTKRGNQQPAWVQNSWE